MSATGAANTPTREAAATAARPAERLLAVAAELFSSQGIRAVGIEQILREAGAAKASLYSTYGSKDALVLAYLADLAQADRNRWENEVRDVSDPVHRLLTFFDLAAVAATRNDFRGCLYANAATEFPGTKFEPVRAHREWLHATVTSLLHRAGANDPDTLARRIQLLYDGALLGSKLERSTEPIVTARALSRDLISAATS